MWTAFSASISLDNEFVSATLMNFAFRDDDCALIHLCYVENLAQCNKEVVEICLMRSMLCSLVQR